MHDSAGHIAHFMNKIAALICEKMKGCDWQLRLRSIDGEVTAKIIHVKTGKKSSAYLGQCDAIERRIRYIRKERKVSERNVEVVTQLRERARLLTIEDETAKDARRH